MSAFEETVESSDEENPTIDGDTCTDIELAKLFRTQFHLAAEECVSLKKSYILNLDASKSWDTIAASTSTKDVHCFSLTESGLVRRPLDTAVQRTAAAGQSSDICGVRFANGDANLLYVGTYDGTIYTYDLRTLAAVSQYRDTDPTAAGGGNSNKDSAAVRKPLLCIDVNANDRVLCAGTERVGCDAYLLFFDTRCQRPMGGYWESHSDDVSQVRFHPTRPDRLASGSTDGLINVYDIGQATEDDALELCMNTESSVAQLQWHTAAAPAASIDDNGDSAASSQADRDLLSCITHVNDLHLYDVADQEQLYAQDREAMAGHVRRSAASECHVVGVHSMAQPGSLFVLAGSNYKRGECLRSLTLSGAATAEPKQPQQKPATITVQPGVMFEQNKQVVRCSLFNANTQMLLTGGESGLITLWAPGVDAGKFKNELKGKAKDRNRKHKAKPY